MNIKVLFFAWLKDEIGKDSCNLNIEETIVSVDDVKRLLAEYLGPNSTNTLSSNNVTCAVNLVICNNHTQKFITNNDEVAFFPPVTGG